MEKIKQLEEIIAWLIPEFLTNCDWPRINFIDKWKTSFWKKPEKE